jgi:hypothetical protein
MTTSDQPRRFPSRWFAEETEACFIVRAYPQAALT